PAAPSDPAAGTLLDRARRWVEAGPADLTCAEGGQRVPLPTYPFERVRHWASAAAPAPATPRPAPLHPTLLDTEVSTADGPAFEKHLLPDAFYLADHQVGGEPVLPGVVHLELARLAGELSGRGRVHAVGGLVWGSPVRPGPDGLRLRVRLEESAGHEAEVPFEVVSTADRNGAGNGAGNEDAADRGTVRHAG
ncbi:hypothetical protein AN220_08880, partial [Streptomyces nanshensis]